MHAVARFFIRTEGKAVGALEIREDGMDRAGKRIDAIDVARQFPLRAGALVVGNDAAMRSGAPDRTVIFGASDAACSVFAGHEPAFPIARVAVGKFDGSRKVARPDVGLQRSMRLLGMSENSRQS